MNTEIIDSVKSKTLAASRNLTGLERIKRIQNFLFTEYDAQLVSASLYYMNMKEQGMSDRMICSQYMNESIILVVNNLQMEGTSSGSDLS